MFAIFAGSIPCTMIARFGGIELLILFLKSIIPSDPLVALFAIYYVFYLLFAISIFHLKNLTRIPDWLLRMFKFSSQIGHFLQGVLLVLSGSIFVVFPSIVWVSPDFTSVTFFIISYMMACALILANCIMLAIKEKFSNWVN